MLDPLRSPPASGDRYHGSLRSLGTGGVYKKRVASLRRLVAGSGRKLCVGGAVGGGEFDRI